MTTKSYVKVQKCSVKNYQADFKIDSFVLLNFKIIGRKVF